MRRACGSLLFLIHYLGHQLALTLILKESVLLLCSLDLDCSPRTVRRRLHRFDAEGIEGLGDRPKWGRPRRLTTEDDSRIIAQVRQALPGQLERRADEMVARDEEGSAQWSLDALAQEAKEVGISVRRSQIRRDALAGQSFANPGEIEQATRLATAQLNHRAKPWVWGCPPKTRRRLRRLFCYRIKGIEHLGSMNDI